VEKREIPLSPYLAKPRRKEGNFLPLYSAKPSRSSDKPSGKKENFPSLYSVMPSRKREDLSLSLLG